nr:uncharacterized protein LOC122272425 [Parasteatoda tepidariorum]
MALRDHTATSRTLSHQIGSFAIQQVSARTVRQRLQQHGLSTRQPWPRLPLTQHHTQELLQWCDQRRTRTQELLDVVFQKNPASVYSIMIAASVLDKDINDKLDSCIILTPEEYGVSAIKHFADFLSMDWSWPNWNALFQDWCAMDEEKEAELFVEAVQYATEVGVSTCADFTKSEACDGIEKASSCGTEILNRLHAEGKC